MFANKEFFRFPFFAPKLGHFVINDFFLYETNIQAEQWKSENEEKKSFLWSATGGNPLK